MTESINNAVHQTLAGSGPSTESCPRLPNIAEVRFQLPPFWTQNLLVCFLQADDQFHLHKITSQTTQYHKMISSLSPEVVGNLTDIVAQPWGESLVPRLKENILAHTVPSERTRLQQLLTSEERGGRHPFQMLHRMRQLFGEGNVNTHSALLKELFLQCLPQPVRLVLAAADDTTLHRLAELTDKIHEAAAPAASVVTTTAKPSAVAQLKARIDDLTAAIALPHEPRRR